MAHVPILHSFASSDLLVSGPASFDRRSRTHEVRMDGPDGLAGCRGHLAHDRGCRTSPWTMMRSQRSGTPP
jgi:hypothetical protein